MIVMEDFIQKELGKINQVCTRSEAEAAGNLILSNASKQSDAFEFSECSESEIFSADETFYATLKKIENLHLGVNKEAARTMKRKLFV